jgi:HPt (histidine-containing phosphotransfer) domain-containing protein
MTAYAMKGDEERCLAAGMDRYVSKPIDPNELFNTLESVVPKLQDSAEENAGEPGAGEVVNQAELLSRVGGDTQLLKQLVELFLRESPPMMEGIRKALKEQDSGALEKAAHTLKGSVGNFAAKEACEAALKLERLGRAQALDGAEEAFRDLERKIERLKLVLTTREVEVKL